MDENVKMEFIETEEMFEIVNEDGANNAEPVYVFCDSNEESHLQSVEFNGEGTYQILFILNSFPNLISSFSIYRRNSIFGRRRRR